MSKGCRYHIVTVQDLDSKIPPIESVPEVIQFLHFSPNDLLGIPPDKGINFGIDLLRIKMAFQFLLIG